MPGAIFFGLGKLFLKFDKDMPKSQVVGKLIMLAGCPKY
jgi:hypothetical protein